jgi:hypothetical protein
MNNVLAYTQQTSLTYFPHKMKAYIVRDNISIPGGTGLRTAGSPEPLTRKLINKGVIILIKCKNSVPNMSILIEHI